MNRKVIVILFIFMFCITSISCRPGSPIINDENASPTADYTQEKPSSVRFVVMADCRGSDKGINKSAVEKTLKSIKKIRPQPSFAVMPGDLVSDGKNYSEIKTQLLHFKDTVTKYYSINFFYPGFGNHEATAGAEGEQAFYDVFPEFQANFLAGYNKTVYYFDRNNIRFFMLNTNHPGEGHTISDTQLNWVKANTYSGGKYNFYFIHEPAYPTGAHIGSSLDANRLQRDKLWKTIDSSRNPMVFCGHEHNYTRRHIDSTFNETVDGVKFEFKKSVYQVTTGTFGAPIYNTHTDTKNIDVSPIPEYHYAIVDVNNNRIQVTLYNIDGKIIDRFEQ